MKRYIYRNLFVLAALALATACSEKETTDQEILDSRESLKLEVSYAYSGAEVNALSFSHSPIHTVLDVSMNNENLKWNLESDSPWCTVVQEEHRGTGPIKLEIAANEDFTPREPATLTFIAGEYRGFTIKVSQSASAFIISQPFFSAPKAGGSYTVQVTTPEASNWSVSGGDWISVTKGESTTAGGMSTTTLTLKPAANTGNSRFGSVTLTSGSEKDEIWFYQFGNELEYDASGNILFPGDGEATLSITIPSYVVKDVSAPAYTHTTITDNGDGTSTLVIRIDKNLSDCAETRPVEMSLLLANAAASVVSIPTIVQDYIPANGLVTSKGLLAFAEAVASGTSTADWEKDGVVVVVQDIDMSGVSGWEGIGSAAKPFIGKFNGNGHSITNLKKASAGLFGYCKGATIENITLAKGCTIYNNKEYEGKGGLGGIVTIAENTTVSGCGFAGELEFAGTSENDDPAYVGGVVGWADKDSNIKSAKMAGKLVISISSSDICFVGGIAGLSLGTLTASEMIGELSFSSGVNTLIAGGIQSKLPAGATVSNNSFMGTITVGGNSAILNVGGLYGLIESDRSFDSASDKSVSLGTINIESYASGSGSRIFAGGFAGKAEPGISLSFKDYEFQTNMSLDQTSSRQSDYICIGGVFGGCEPAEDEGLKALSFENISNLGYFATAYEASLTTQLARGFIGGVAGFANAKSVTFKGCTNNGEIGKLTAGANSANSKNYVLVLGGIAGVVIGGDASFSKCENKGMITNKHYSNCIPENNRDGWYTACTAAGILGAFDPKVESVSGKLTMSECTNGALIASYRGMAGGLIGYARNATISGCTNLGDLGQNSTSSSNAAYKGGIACWLSQSTVADCVAKCNVFCSNPASAVQSPGGIVALSTGGGVTITGCSYYGIISVNKGDQPSACGGILSTGEEDSVVSDCRYGGKINGIDISENNVSTYVLGNGTGSASNITLWNGNI